MRIGLLQLNAVIGAFDENRAKLEEAYAKAVEQGAELVVAPELFLCGYPPRDLLLREDFVQRGLDGLQELAKKVGAVPLIVGYAERSLHRPGRRAFQYRGRDSKRQGFAPRAEMPAAHLRCL